MLKFDVAVIGTGPAGQKAAVLAAKLGKKVAIVEKKQMLGGVCTHLGTIPSKTLREAVLHLSGFRQRGIYGQSYMVKKHITMSNLNYHINHVVKNEVEVVGSQMLRNGIEMLTGEASFSGPGEMLISNGEEHETLQFEHAVIATGTNPAHNPAVPFDGCTVFNSDDIFTLDYVPKTMTVVGAGVIGLEYASILATLGMKVTLIDKRKRLLNWIDEEIVDALIYQMRQMGIILRLGEEVDEISVDESDKRVRTHLKSGKQVITDKLLYCVGRNGSTYSLGLDTVGISTDKRGYIKVDEQYRTEAECIYAVGDVVGYPSLASTSMEQGRLAACHICGVQTKSFTELFPFGIYTIPEISTCGRSEEELTAAGVPYESGHAFYRETARGQIIGDYNGMLKLLFHRETLELLGVHVIGEGAAELVHVGQAVLQFKGKVDYFINNVFNFPTLAEAYKIASVQGLNKIDYWNTDHFSRMMG